MHFDLVDLRLMVRIAEANSLTKGAEASHISLPAASTRIKNLEEGIGTRLLNRTSQGVTLTPPGQAFVHHARMVLGQIQHLRGDLQEYTRGVKGHLRVFANTTALGEFLPPVLRSYSLSNLPNPGCYRVTIKKEQHGIASTYVGTQLRTDDVLDVSEPRGAFTLRRGDLPIVLLSAGVGGTPVMAMLHALTAQASPCPVWWIYGARNHLDHPFALEARDLLAKLPHTRSYILYSRPDATDRWVSISMLPAA